jgi:hypothetical protein
MRLKEGPYVVPQPSVPTNTTTTTVPVYTGTYSFPTHYTPGYYIPTYEWEERYGSAQPSRNPSLEDAGLGDDGVETLPSAGDTIYNFYYPTSNNQSSGGGGIGDWLSWLLPLMLLKMMMGGKKDDDDEDEGGLF